jgi:hypothetical protein
MQASPAALAAYEAALPDDPRVQRKKMFGVPCAFVNRQMFFGTFDDSLIARVGPARVAVLVKEAGKRVFEPMEGRAWGDYVQLEPGLSGEELRRLATESLAWAAALPEKAKPPKRKK